jgi:hypothetical protein
MACSFLASVERVVRDGAAMVALQAIPSKIGHIMPLAASTHRDEAASSNLYGGGLN